MTCSRATTCSASPPARRCAASWPSWSITSYERHFITLQTADLHPSKPHPAMLLAAMAETGTPAASTMLLGDTSYDILMARAAGAVPIGVSWGNHPAPSWRRPAPPACWTGSTGCTSCCRTVSAADTTLPA